MFQCFLATRGVPSLIGLPRRLVLHLGALTQFCRVNRQIFSSPESHIVPKISHARPRSSQRRPSRIMIGTIDHNLPTYFYMKQYEFGLPSTIRTCDLRLRRIRGCWNEYKFQWLIRFNRGCVINCAMKIRAL